MKIHESGILGIAETAIFVSIPAIFSRIEKAKGLLRTTDLPIQEVGWLTGFPNAQHFSIRFRKMSGQPPRDFRRKPKRRNEELNPQ